MSINVHNKVEKLLENDLSSWNFSVGFYHETKVQVEFSLLNVKISRI